MQWPERGRQDRAATTTTATTITAACTAGKIPSRVRIDPGILVAYEDWQDVRDRGIHDRWTLAGQQRRHEFLHGLGVDQRGRTADQLRCQLEEPRGGPVRDPSVFRH